MSEVYFEDPMANDYKNPAPELMKEFIFERGDDFWDIGKGDAGVDFSENGKKKSHINLKGLADYGFMIRHRYSGDNERLYTLRVGERTGEIVEAEIGGDSKLYYREYFVPKEVAWEAIEHFLQTGERKSDLIWELAQYPEQEV